MFTREEDKCRAQFWLIVLFTIMLSMSVSACSITLFNSNCSGQNVSCGGRSTVLSPDATAQAQAQATLAALTSEPPLANDSLTAQDNNQWADNPTCFFANGEYVVTVDSQDGSGAWPCDSGKFYYGDAVIQVDVTLISGDAAGILLRATPQLSEFYEFMVSESKFGFGVLGTNNTFTQIIPGETSSAIHEIGQVNRLAVIEKGNDFRFFINGTFVGETHDDTLTEGYTGMVIQFDPGGKALFSHLTVYAA